MITLAAENINWQTMAIP